MLTNVPDIRAEAIVWLMVGLGLRCIEVANLQVGDYDRQSQVLTVTGKGGHQRILPVPSEAAHVFDRYLDSQAIGAGPMIRSQHNPRLPISPKWVSGLVSSWMGAAGIKTGIRDGRSAHALRHTAASDVLDNCGDLRVVQEMLGHVHLATTSIYLRRAGMDKMREAMEGRDYRSA